MLHHLNQPAALLPNKPGIQTAPQIAHLEQTLNSCVGQHVSSFCDCEFTSDLANHCAHFVGHFCGISVGHTCKIHTGRGGVGASLRVHEIFSHCSAVAAWNERQLGPCLIYLVAAGNVHLSTKQMNNVDEKHMGILSSGLVWHYSNRRRKVVSEELAAFVNWYDKTKVEIFTGLPPHLD
jgi:hypothetical protein